MKTINKILSKNTKLYNIVAITFLVIFSIAFISLIVGIFNDYSLIENARFGGVD